MWSIYKFITTIVIISFIWCTEIWSADFDCQLVKDWGIEIKKQLNEQSYWILNKKNIDLAIDHLFNACCRWDKGWQLWNEICSNYLTPVWPQSMYLFDQLISIGFEKINTIRWDAPLFDTLPRSDYDIKANERYDYIKDQMIPYEGILPEVIAEQFEQKWKIDIVGLSNIPEPCAYELPTDIWLVGKYYNVCDIAYCVMNNTYVRTILTQQWFLNQSTNKDFVNCKTQATKLINDHIKQTQAIIQYKAFAYLHNNRINYVNELIGASLMPKLLETINGITSDLGMVINTAHPRAEQCFPW